MHDIVALVQLADLKTKTSDFFFFFVMRERRSPSMSCSVITIRLSEAKPFQRRDGNRRTALHLREAFDGGEVFNPCSAKIPFRRSAEPLL